LNDVAYWHNSDIPPACRMSASRRKAENICS
jgi:hypothetical protein